MFLPHAYSLLQTILIIAGLVIYWHLLIAQQQKVVSKKLVSKASLQTGQTVITAAGQAGIIIHILHHSVIIKQHDGIVTEVLISSLIP